MSELFQTIMIGSILIATLGFLVYKLNSSLQRLRGKKNFSCHGDSETCEHCADES